MVPEGLLDNSALAAASVPCPPWDQRENSCCSRTKHLAGKGRKVKVLSGRLLAETLALIIMYDGAVIVNRDRKQHRIPLPRRRSHLYLTFIVLQNIKVVMKNTAILIGRPKGACLNM